MKKRRPLLLALYSAAFLLTGCMNNTYRTSDANVDKTKQQIQQAKMVTGQASSPVVSTAGFYVDPKPIALNAGPKWLKQPVTLHANDMPFDLLMHRLLRNTPVVNRYNADINAKRLVSINYRGSIAGALNVLAAETDYHYTAHTHNLEWSAFETKSFNVSFMPGSSNYLVGQRQSNGSSTTASTNPNNALGQINDQQYSNMAGELSLWHDLKRTLDELKSPHGRVVVSESTTSVTVHDRPSNVHAMGQYIAQLNKHLSQEVAIKVQVLEVALKKEFHYGINWNVVANALDTRFNLVGNLGSATNLTENALMLTGGTSADASLRFGQLTGAHSLINALSQQGKVRVVTEPEVVTMNNQVASIRITKNVGYVESISQSQSQNFLTTSITPGSITDGFTLYVLPKIQNNKIYMQLSSTIASLERLQKVSTSDTGTNGSTSQQAQAIQVPTLAQKAFNQRSAVTSGSTLIIAGYKRLHDAVSKAGLFGIDQLGGYGAQNDNIETLVLITPVILHSSKSNVHINT